MGSLQQRYQDIKIRYEGLNPYDTSQLQSLISNFKSTTPGANDLDALKNYSNNLAAIAKDLRQLLQDQSQNKEEGGASEQRYNERMYPERDIEAREVAGSFVTELRPTTIPAIMALATFMAAISIFLIFQLFGLRGSISLPPAVGGLIGPSVPGALPFYKNPMVLAGVVILLLISTGTFGFLYYQSWKKQQR